MTLPIFLLQLFFSCLKPNFIFIFYLKNTKNGLNFFSVGGESGKRSNLKNNWRKQLNLRTTKTGNSKNAKSSFYFYCLLRNFSILNVFKRFYSFFPVKISIKYLKMTMKLRQNNINSIGVKLKATKKNK